MKIIFAVLVLYLSVVFVSAQAISSVVEVATVYSQNGKYYLKTVPYDNELPTLRGKTSVYEIGNPNPLYKFERAFDAVNENNLILSNDGESIFYAVSWSSKEEELKNITIYKHGKLMKSFTEAEITNCDDEKEQCRLIYSNYNEVIDKEKSNYGTKNYKKVIKDGVDEKEIFLSNFPIFNIENTVYLVDYKRRVHLFDLSNGSYISSDPFENIYEKIKREKLGNKTEIEIYDTPQIKSRRWYLDFPNLKDGTDTAQILADYLGMKPASTFEEKDEQYKLYSFKVNSSILQDGSIEIENIEFYDNLPKDKITAFFTNNKFDSSAIPKIFEKWYLREKYFHFRNKNDKFARKEKQQELNQEREEFKKRLTAEKINDVYIPKDLGECFTELDRLLKEVDRKEMQSLPKREDMIKYHHGLGMWLRNNWGLWGGSRLQKYFTEKGINHPDEMSGIILEFYHDWLNGKKETWKDWEKNPKQ